MFSTPQSKAFFSQQIVKGKLIAEEIQLMQVVFDRIERTKNSIAEIIKVLWQREDNFQEAAEKLNTVCEALALTFQNVLESNEQFSFQVSLRSDIKLLEQVFFKRIMMTYQQKIKQLKHGLLCLQNEVQALQQKGLLPYVESPAKNSTLACKTKNFQEFKQKINILNDIVDEFQMKKLEGVIVSIVDTIIHRKQIYLPHIDMDQSESKSGKMSGELENIAKQPLDKSYEIKEGPEEVVEQVEPEKKLQLKGENRKKKEQVSRIYELLRILESWSEVMNFRLRKSIRDHKERIEVLSTCNKSLKEGIRNYKKIMNYEQNEAMVRCQQIQLTREQSIDFLRQMNEDLQTRFSRRNIYMIISLQPDTKRTKSCIEIPHPSSTPQPETHRPCLREVNPNLNNSFLDQCSYLISDRFIAEEDQNQEMIV